jgi:hypothetical protein
MEKEFPGLSNEDAIKAENDYLKMKMMLERGAQFGSTSDACTPEMENQFLKRVMEFEQMADNTKLIRLFERIGSPPNVRPITDIRDDEIVTELDKLMLLMNEHGISLSVLNSDVSPKEIYRFIIEELFEEQVPESAPQGMMTGFIYDLYHPEVRSINEHRAVNDCIRPMLSDFEMCADAIFRSKDLQLNDIFPLDIEAFCNTVNQFKKRFDEVAEVEVDDVQSHLEKPFCFVRGRYKFVGRVGSEHTEYTGRWLVNMEQEHDKARFQIVSVELEGIEF